MYKSYLAFVYKFIIACTRCVYTHCYTPVNSQWFQTHGTGTIHTSNLLTKLINSFTFVLMKRSCNSLHSATDMWLYDKSCITYTQLNIGWSIHAKTETGLDIIQILFYSNYNFSHEYLQFRLIIVQVIQCISS